MNKISLLIIIMTSFVLSTTEIYAETNTDDLSEASFFYGEFSVYQMDKVLSRNINPFIEKETFVLNDNDLSAAAFFYGILIPDPIAEVKFKSGAGLQVDKEHAKQSTERMSPQNFFY